MSDPERSLLARVEAAAHDDASAGASPAAGPRSRGGRSGPPPLAPFGLVLHHDARWTHEGHPISNRKLRERFDRSVVYVPQAKKYVVQIGHFRGEIEVEEAGFFVRSVELARGTVRLSDGSDAPLEVASLASSAIDNALICRVKRELAPEGLPARFMHAAQAELLNAVEDEAGAHVLEVAGERAMLPEL
jgi:hypothetical protein